MDDGAWRRVLRRLPEEGGRRQARAVREVGGRPARGSGQHEDLLEAWGEGKVRPPSPSPSPSPSVFLRDFLELYGPYLQTYSELKWRS